MTLHQLDCEFKNGNGLVNNELRDSLLMLLSKIEKHSLYMAARVAQSMTISLLDYTVGMHCGIQFSMTSSIKLETNNVPIFWHT